MPPNTTPSEVIEITVTVNGETYTRDVPSRLLLVDFLRDELGLTGTKIGCETSVCGCCTVLLDDARVKSCTVLVGQADGKDLTTIEGLADNGELSVLQSAFSEHHALQCGYCTAGMVMSATGLLREHPDPTREEIKHGLTGNLCRCTGYTFIIDAIEDASSHYPSAKVGGPAGEDDA